MRNRTHLRTVRVVIGLMAAASIAAAQQQNQDQNTTKSDDANTPAQNRNAGTNTPSVIGSHQIDRFDAIKQVQDAVKSDPNSVADWMILGELAQEVATEVPADQSASYYHIARDAYEKALKLKPDNPGIKAALQFVKDQEANAERFNSSRQRTTSAYLDARRRELNQANASPTLRVYSTTTSPPVTTTTPAPATTTTSTPVGGQPYYPYGYPYYRPFVGGQPASPYTYNQYANSYFPPGYGLGNTATTTTATGQPITFRQYAQQLPGVLANQAVRGITTPRPR